MKAITLMSARIVAAAAMTAMAACQPTPDLYTFAESDTAEEVGNVFVSAYPAVAWSDIKDKLEPKHNLTTEQAKAIAAQATQVQVAQFLSTFSAGLALGLPTHSNQKTTTLAADGTETTTGTRVRGSGPIPASSGITATSIPDTALTPDYAKVLPGLGIDANTLLSAGTAVYQTAQILDNQISKSIYPTGYQVHLVTVQVNLQPRRRDYAYDAYVDLSFLPGDWQTALKSAGDVNTKADALPPIIVYPLIITDALETTSVGRSIETIRQAALQLSGIVYNVGASAGIGGSSDKLDSVLGADKNSLMTVGRVSDHTLRVRLGAHNSGSSGNAMVPRTHNVSVVVLTRWDGAKVEDDKAVRLKTLSLISETTFTSAKTGKDLQSGRIRSPASLAGEVAWTAGRYGQDKIVLGCAASKTAENTVVLPTERGAKLAKTDEIAADVQKSLLTALRALDRGDYVTFQRCFGIDDNLSVDQQMTLRRLIAKLMEIQSSSRYSKMMIALRGKAKPELPPEDQIVTIRDDNKKTSVVLRRGEGLDASLAAYLILADTSKSHKLIASAISIEKEGAVVEASFPSLSQLSITDDKLAAKPLRLTIGEDGKTQKDYAVVKYKADPEPAPENPVKATQAIILADQNGVGRFSLQLGKIPDGISGPLKLLVSGADIRADSSIGAPGPSADGINIAANGSVTLLAGNLTPTRPVVVTTIDVNKKPVGAPITLTVFSSGASKN